MTTEAVYETLSEVLRDVFDDDSLVARPDLTADQVAGWDSFAHLRLIFTIEKTFHVNFSASEISGLKDVGELAALIQAKTNK